MFSPNRCNSLLPVERASPVALFSTGEEVRQRLEQHGRLMGLPVISSYASDEPWENHRQKPWPITTQCIGGNTPESDVDFKCGSPPGQRVWFSTHISGLQALETSRRLECLKEQINN